MWSKKKFHHFDKSCIYIQLFAKIYLYTPVGLSKVISRPFILCCFYYIRKIIEANIDISKVKLGYVLLINILPLYSWLLQ